MSRSASRTEKLDIRLTPEAKATLHAAAAASRRSLSDFVLSSAMISAEEMLADRRRFVLDPDRFDAFVTALDAPPMTHDRLSRLMRERSVFEPDRDD